MKLLINATSDADNPSHSPRSGWIEMVHVSESHCDHLSHSPRSGWIEMPVLVFINNASPPSHSPRSGWIEIKKHKRLRRLGKRPTPHGVGGLKSATMETDCIFPCPTPHGVGGLKFLVFVSYKPVHVSHSPRSGWIEIFV